MLHAFVVTQRKRLGAAIILLALAALAFPAHAAREARLVDQRGHTFTLSQLRNKPLVVTFISAHCQDVCPLINAQTARAIRHAQHAELRMTFLTITLDPERDSLADMRNLARTFGADPRYWIVAGGAIEDVHAIMQAFRVTAQRGVRGYADVHTTFVYLVDKHGVIRSTMLASNNFDRDIIGAIRSDWRVLTQ